ncbi:MAG TPA: ice-binding family protein [Acidimicrobiales bacterium]
MTRPRAAVVAIGAVAAASLGLANVAGATATSVPLGTTFSFGVLAASTVTNTGPSVINGDVGLSPGTSVTGFPPGTLNGTLYAANAVSGQAKNDLTTAYNNAVGQGPTTPIIADLGGQTLTAGVYNSASSIGLTGILTLNGGGNPASVFVFQADSSTLTTASLSQVNLINGAQACNVFWQVGSSATLGTDSTFVGTVLASQSITVTTNVTILGRVLAENGAVTLDSDTITPSSCATTSVTTTTTASGAGTSTATNASGTGTSTATTVPGTVSSTANAVAAKRRKAAANEAAADKAATAKAAPATTTHDSTTSAVVPTAPMSPIGTTTVSVTG